LEYIKNLPLPLSVYKIKYTNDRGKEIKKLEYIFTSELKDDANFKIDGKEIRDFRWFTLAEIESGEEIFEQTKLLAKKL